MQTRLNGQSCVRTSSQTIEKLKNLKVIKVENVKHLKNFTKLNFHYKNWKKIV